MKDFINCRLIDFEESQSHEEKKSRDKNDKKNLLSLRLIQSKS